MNKSICRLLFATGAIAVLAVGFLAIVTWLGPPEDSRKAIYGWVMTARHVLRRWPKDLQEARDVSMEFHMQLGTSSLGSIERVTISPLDERICEVRLDGHLLLGMPFEERKRLLWSATDDAAFRASDPRVWTTAHLLKTSPNPQGLRSADDPNAIDT